MSSLSRRACFKCGNVGHYAGEPTLSWAAIALRVHPLRAHVAGRRFSGRSLRRIMRNYLRHATNSESQRFAPLPRGFATTVRPIRNST